MDEPSHNFFDLTEEERQRRIAEEARRTLADSTAPKLGSGSALPEALVPTQGEGIGLVRSDVFSDLELSPEKRQGADVLNARPSVDFRPETSFKPAAGFTPFGAGISKPLRDEVPGVEDLGMVALLTSPKRKRKRLTELDIMGLK